MPYWTTDIGAFFVARKPALWFWSGDYDDGVADLGYRELYLRWFQYAAWLPMLRSHGTDTPRELWRFGEPGDAIYDGLVEALRLRYRLLPYLYSIAAWTTSRAYTMLRALPFDFREDACTYDAADQFMFGPAFLVAPVLAPIRYGPRSQVPEAPEVTRRVYLPAGTDWYRPVDGSSPPWAASTWTSRSPSSTSRCSCVPVRSSRWARSGSMSRTSPTRRSRSMSTEATTRRSRSTRTRATAMATSRAPSATMELNWDDAAGRLSIGQRVGAYPNMPVEREITLVVHDGAPGSGPDTAAASARRLCYAGDPVIVNW